MSRGTAQTIRICSVEVSPDLILLNIRKVDFRGFIGKQLHHRSVQEDRTDHTNLFRRSFTGSGLTEHQKCQCSWFWEFLEGYFITEVSKRTARTPRICSIEVSPDLVLLNIRKVGFHDFQSYWEIASSQKCPGGPRGPGSL